MKRGIALATKKAYRQTAFDEEFRKNVLKLLKMAKKEVIVVTGEAGSYQYQDLRWEVERVRERGVSFKIYCVRPLKEYVNQLLRLGCDVFIGEEDVKEHFFLVDRKSCMTSVVRPRLEIGKRAGEVRINDRKFAIGKIRLFRELVSKAKKERKMRVEEDPLWKLINNPLDFGFDTHSERFEEEL